MVKREPTGDSDGLFQVQMGQSQRFHQGADLHFSKRQISSARCWLPGVYLQSKAPVVTIFKLSPYHHWIAVYVNAGTVLVAEKQAICNRKKKNVYLNII